VPLWTPQFTDLPVTGGAQPKRYVDQTSWSALLDNFANWKDNVNAGGKNLSNLGLVTFGAGKYVNNTLPVGTENVDGIITVGGAGLLTGDSWSWDTVFGYNFGVRNPGGSDQLYTLRTHGSIGYGGIRLGAGTGFINFYLEAGATTAGATVTPTPRAILSTDGFNIEGWRLKLNTTAGGSNWTQLQLLGGAAEDSRAWRVVSDANGLFGVESATDNMTTTARHFTINRNGRIKVTTPPAYANNAAAIAGGLVAGEVYIPTSGDPRTLCIVV
jgi:hypothetical protein